MFKVLFVGSGNKNHDVPPILRNQGESLSDHGYKIEYFLISGRGLFGYLSQIIILKRKLRRNSYHIIHAHYSLSGIVAYFAKKNEKLIVSFLGDDILGTNKKNGRITKISILLSKFNLLFSRFFLDHTIVKSKEMANRFRTKKNLSLIPNGVNIEHFRPFEKIQCQKHIGFNSYEFNLLFVADPARPEKNFQLIQEGVINSQIENIKLHTVFNLPNAELPFYYSGADVLILTSFHEGSPNVIKEAMACNCPIVSTDVGDVKWVIGNTEGCYLTSFNPHDVVDKIIKALEFSRKKNRTKGRERIMKLGLDSENIAGKIISVYKKVLEQ
jgi:glycosyltransferase involved in cell wall biosynthesis